MLNFIVYQLDRFSRNKYDSVVNKNKLKANSGVKEVLKDGGNDIQMGLEYLPFQMKDAEKLNTEMCLKNDSRLMFY